MGKDCGRRLNTPGFSTFFSVFLSINNYQQIFFVSSFLFKSKNHIFFNAFKILTIISLHIKVDMKSFSHRKL